MSAMHPRPQSPASPFEEEPFDAAAFLADPKSYAAGRRDGWTGARQKAFLEILADTGEAEFAAEAVGMTIQSAYALRRRPGGHGFACGWAVALRHAGQKLIDTAYSRALATREEPIISDGQVVGTRVKQNDRMLIYLINRIDKINRGDVIDMPSAPDQRADYDRVAEGRYIEAHTEDYLACVERDGDAAWEAERVKEAEIDAQFEADCAIRRGLACPVPKEDGDAEPDGTGDDTDAAPSHTARFMAKARLLAGTIYSADDEYGADAGDIAEQLAQLENHRKLADTAPEDIDISDLDTAAALQWTGDQWERADKSGLLARMDDAWWDEIERQRAEEMQSSGEAGDSGHMDSPNLY